MFIFVFSHTVTLKFSRHKCPNHSDKLSLHCLIQNHFHLNPYEDATGNYREYSQQASGRRVSCIVHALLRQHLAGLLEKFLSTTSQCTSDKATPSQKTTSSKFSEFTMQCSEECLDLYIGEQRSSIKNTDRGHLWALWTTTTEWR